MAKEPARRYPTTGELADDLRRFLRDEPIRARPVARIEKLWRWGRRNPAVVGLTAAVAALLGVVVGALIWGLHAQKQEPPAPAVAGKPDPSPSADDLLNVVAELDRTDPGWRLEQIEAARKVIPDDTNGAQQVRKVVALLRSARWPSREMTERKSFAAGPPARLSAEDEAFLRAELGKVSDARSEAQKLTAFPDGRLHVVWGRTGMDISMNEQQEIRNVAELLRWDATLRAQEGDVSGALRSCRCVLHCGRVIGDEPIHVSQLVRIALANMAVSMAERALAQGEADDAELSALQSLLEAEAEHPRLRIMARALRGAMHWTLSAIAAGDFTPAEYARKLPPKQRDLVEAWPTGPTIRAAHAQVLREMTRWVEITGRPLPEQRRLTEEWERAQPPVVKRLLSSFAAGWSTLYPRFQAALDSSRAALAVERYRRARGDWPGDLAALVPAFCKEVPKGPYDGQPLRYRRVANGVVVYSVGPDLTDDRGNLAGSRVRVDGTDIGFRLWDVEKRRRPAGGGGP
jgi:hypothetical protein